MKMITCASSISSFCTTGGNLPNSDATAMCEPVRYAVTRPKKAMATIR